MSATTRDGTTRAVNVDGDWHQGLGPGSFQEAIPIGLERLGLTDGECKAIGAEVLEA